LCFRAIRNDNLESLENKEMADIRWIFKVWCDLNQSELDSHTDTCLAGTNTRVTDYTNTKVNVSPFSDSYEAIRPGMTQKLAR
jgi:hypothetical protein